MTYRAKAYPYPVLSSFSNDFDDGSSLQIQIDPDEAFGDIEGENAESGFSLAYEIELSCESMEEYLVHARPRVVIDVDCRTTLFREFRTLDSLSGEIGFEPGEICGEVTITPLIVADRDDTEYRPSRINAEFGSDPHLIRRGDILAIGNSVVVELEFNRILEEDLLTVQFTDDIEYDNIYKFSFNGSKIIVFAGEKLREPIARMRSDNELQPFLFMSIWKDCLNAALDYLAGLGEGATEEVVWGRRLNARLEEIGRPLIPDSPDEQAVTAQLLVAPHGIDKLEVPREQ